MKQTVIVCIILIILLTFVGCNKNSVENAMWEKYEYKSFLEYLQIGIEGLYYFEDYIKVDKVIVKYKEGWNDYDALTNEKII